MGLAERDFSPATYHSACQPVISMKTFITLHYLLTLLTLPTNNHNHAVVADEANAFDVVHLSGFCVSMTTQSESTQVFI